MKAVKFFLAAGLSLMLGSFSMFGQNASFAGTWAFNEAKSTQAEGGFRMAPDKLVVTQEANLLTVVRTTQRGETTERITLDGKESVNPTGFGETNRTSVATWSADGKSLSIASVMKFEREGQSNEFKSTDVWKLNADNTLSVETTSSSQFGEMKFNAVYDKK